MLIKKLNIEIYSLNDVNELPFYIDGADQIDHKKHMIKGKGGALTQEKIIASCAKEFICLASNEKISDVLGKYCPVPVEVLPMARSYVARCLAGLGASVVYRNNFITDNIALSAVC